MPTKPTASSAPSSKVQCIRGCKHTAQGDVCVTQHRCLSCFELYHIDCVGLPEEESNGSFACPTCRQLPPKAESTLNAVDVSNNTSSNLNDEFLSLKDCIKSMAEKCVVKIANLERKHSDEMVQKDQKLDQKNKEIEYLNSKINDLEKAVQVANGEKLLLQLVIQLKDAEIVTLKNSSTSNKYGNTPRRDALLSQPIKNSNTSNKDGNIPRRDTLLSQPINQPLNRAASGQPGGSSNSHGTSLNPDAESFMPGNSTSIPVNINNIPKTPIGSSGSQHGTKPMPRTGRAKDSLLTVSERQTVMRANYFSVEVSEELVQAYLESVLNYYEVQVELIKPPSHIVQPTYKCFKITAPSVYDQQLLSPDIWPEGITFRRYHPNGRRTLPPTPPQQLQQPPQQQQQQQ